ncbi:MAG: class I SAM-dependent DNA methyltransferase [Myxococcota bacterium]
MITGELKNKVDRLWLTFHSNGIANPLSVIEQLTYLIFMKRLDDDELAGEAKARRGGSFKSRFAGVADELRWSRLRHQTGETLLKNAGRAFEHLKTLQGAAADTPYARHMKDAVFLITKAGLLQSAIEQLEELPWRDQDQKGDLYEYMLSKLSTAGTNGQFRTPRHIIRMMVKLRAPTLDDTILDPACGTAGFLVGVADHLRETLGDRLYSDPRYARYRGPMFAGFDFDGTMLRIGTMNLLLHGIESPVIEHVDALSTEQAGVVDRYSLILANPPFKGSIDMDGVSEVLLKDLGMSVNKKAKRPTKSDAQDLGKEKKGPGAKTELLFVAEMLRALKVGGRCAVIVPDGVLFGSTNAHMKIRKTLVEEHLLEGVVSMPAGVFRPYAGVSTAVLLFTKTGAGGTENIWFYDMEADGFSLDDKRKEIPEDDIPDVIGEWIARFERKTEDRSRKAFFVAKADIVAGDYNLSVARYRQAVVERRAELSSAELLDRLEALQEECATAIAALREVLR